MCSRCWRRRRGWSTACACGASAGGRAAASADRVDLGGCARGRSLLPCWSCWCSPLDVPASISIRHTGRVALAATTELPQCGHGQNTKSMITLTRVCAGYGWAYGRAWSAPSPIGAWHWYLACTDAHASPAPQRSHPVSHQLVRRHVRQRRARDSTAIQQVTFAVQLVRRRVWQRRMCRSTAGARGDANAGSNSARAQQPRQPAASSSGTSAAISRVCSSAAAVAKARSCPPVLCA